MELYQTSKVNDLGVWDFDGIR